MFLGHLSFWGYSGSANLIQIVNSNFLDSLELSASMSNNMCELKWLGFSIDNPGFPELNILFFNTMTWHHVSAYEADKH